MIIALPWTSSQWATLELTKLFQYPNITTDKVSMASFSMNSGHDYALGLIHNRGENKLKALTTCQSHIKYKVSNKSVTDDYPDHFCHQARSIITGAVRSCFEVKAWPTRIGDTHFIDELLSDLTGEDLQAINSVHFDEDIPGVTCVARSLSAASEPPPVRIHDGEHLWLMTWLISKAAGTVIYFGGEGTDSYHHYPRVYDIFRKMRKCYFPTCRFDSAILLRGKSPEERNIELGGEHAVVYMWNTKSERQVNVYGFTFGR